MIKTNEKKEEMQKMDTKGPALVPKAAIKQWVRKEKVYLGAASHLKHATLSAMRTRRSCQYT